MSKYFESIKPIRNKIRKYNCLSVLHLCEDFLRQSFNDPIKAMKNGIGAYQVNLIAELAITELTSDDKRKPNISLKDFNSIYKMFKDLATDSVSLDTLEDGIRFFRLSSNSQLWYQESPSFIDIARTMYLFSKTKKSEYIDSQCQKNFGLFPLEVNIFITTIATYFNTIKKTNLITCDSLELFKGTRIEKFVLPLLNKISLNLLDMNIMIKVFNEEIKTENWRYWRKSFFRQRPLLNLENGTYLAINRQAIFQSIQYFLYTYLKNINPGEFGTEFGYKFEDYIRTLLNESNFKYLDGKGIKDFTKSKDVDFMLSKNEVNIMIEAKGSILKDLGILTTSGTVFFNSIESSVFKAITQGLEVASFFPNKRNYLLIITFDNFYMNSPGSIICPESFREEIIKHKSDMKYNDTDLKNTSIYIITLKELDIFISLLIQYKLDIFDELEKINTIDIQNMGDYGKSQFDFMSHIRRIAHEENIEPLPFLVKYYEESLKEILNIPYANN